LSLGAKLLAVYVVAVALFLIVAGVVLVPRLATTATRFSTAPELTPRPGATLPPEMPAGFPIYPGATLVDGRDEGGGRAIVLWETRDATSRVYSFYRSSLNAGGWRVTQAIDVGPLMQVQFARSDQAFPTGQVVIQGMRGGGSLIALELIPTPFNR
jgi:hypothetical protein